MERIQEFGRSILLIEDETTEEFEFMSRMLEDNKIIHIIPFQRGIYENKTVIKLDVTNQISLVEEFESKLMSGAELRKLLLNILETINIGYSYLLEEKFLEFSPEYIFKNSENDSLNMVYIPFQKEEDSYTLMRGKYNKLAEFFLEKIDHRDEKAVDIAYKFYKMAKEEYFSISAFCEMFEKESIHIKEEEEKTDKIRISTYDRPDFKDVYEPYCMEDNNANNGSASLFARIMTKMTSILFGRSKREIKMPDKAVTVEEYWGGDSETVFFDTEETVFFDKDEGNNHSLKWEEAGEQKECKIREFPAIIGKKYDLVDICISDETVSRKHAKIMLKHGEMVLCDLGSKNGTYVNEKRLSGGENVKIDASTQIRFGKVVVDVV